jgi:uncharacterized membrane protein
MRVVREALAVLAAVGSIVLLAVNWHTIPDIVPVHFGLSGAPNRFGPKRELWLIAGIGLLVYVVLLVVGRLPRTYNLPATADDPDRARQEVLARELIAWLRLETAWIFAYVLWAMVQVAHGARTGMGIWVLPALLPTVFATCAIFLVRMFAGAKS